MKKNQLFKIPINLGSVIGTTLLVSLSLASPLGAASPVPITNAGFEDPVLDDGAFSGGNIPGWSAVDGGNIGVLNPGSGDLTAGAPEGENVASLISNNAENGLGQTVGSLFQEDANYTLIVDVGNTLFATDFPGYRVQLLAGTTVLAEDDNTQTIAEDAVVTSTVNYTYDAADVALVGEPLEIRLLSKGLADGQEVAFDNVRLSATLVNPAASPGGPYMVSIAGNLQLDGSASQPSDGQTLTSWEWDLDNDGNFDDATGETPTPISRTDLETLFGMVSGNNTIQLRVTDDSSPTPKTATAQGTVNLGEPLLIYEPFNDLDPTLADNTPGQGLTGTWSGQSLVAEGSLIYGGLAYEGGRATSNPGNNYDQNGISPGTSLTDAGLMADGATLWFSALIVNHTSPDTSDERTYVSLGTGVADGFDRIGGNAGSGFTVAVSKVSEGGVTGQAWNDGSDGAGGATRGDTVALAENATFLAVGKITWGEFGVTPDTFELYLPDESLNLGAAVSTITADFDQLGTVNAENAFDTISIAGGNSISGVPEVDEIRFGVDYAAVTPLDETPPVLVSTNPVDDSPSGNATQQVATFDEPVVAGTGDIRIVNDTDTVTTTIPVGDPQIVVSGNTLSITPTVPLIGGKAYHIEIDAGAVTNINGSAFGGISSATEWNFTADGAAPIVASIEDNVSPLPILINSSLTYTVTFDEPIDAGTVEIADFANSGSATVTIDSVTATGDPAVFEVVVSTLAAGDLTLEIVQNAVITDLTGNPLDTSSAIPDDTTIPVNDPTPTAATFGVDFQATIASEQHPDYAGEARYFHVSVNPNNAGTGSYAATIVGTNDPAGAFVRNYTDPVVAYNFAGGGSGDLGVAMSGGDASLINHTTPDVSFDGFGQQQAKVWDATDPGSDLATGGANPFNATADANSGLFRSLGGAVGTIDISGLTSGSVHIYYGAFGTEPSVRVTMRDTDNQAEDIVISNAHLNADSADRTEYYLAEIDFVTDGFYDVIEYEWLANGVDYTGNGRGLGTVLTGQSSVGGSPYADWAAINAPTGNPDDDFDGDGVSNAIELVLGGDKDTSDLDKLPAVTTENGDMTFTFVRDRVSVDASVSVVIEVGTDLVTWPDVYTVGADTGSSTAGVTVTDNLDGTDTITLTVTQAPDAKKFARLKVEVTP